MELQIFLAILLTIFNVGCITFLGVLYYFDMKGK
jgi:hypothetical protein